MEEKRREPRIETCLTARWQGSTARQSVRVSDLSRGGCYVDTIVGVTAGENLRLQILMGDGSWFDLEAVVAYQSPGMGFGVRFVNLNEKQLRQISSLLGIKSLDSPEPDDPSDTCEPALPLDDVALTTPIVM